MRRELLAKLSIDGLHLFESRKAHFEADAVLQEALITWGTAGALQQGVRVSRSMGAADFGVVIPQLRTADEVLCSSSGHETVLPDFGAAVDTVASQPLRLAGLGMRVLTGPVVGFRAAAHLRPAATRSTVSLLWMPHVRRLGVAWPRGHRAEHIERNNATEWMLLPNEPFVLLRRFSPKEDVRRVTATAYLADLPGERIGIETTT